MNNFSRKLQALLWKNFKLKLRNPCWTVCEIVAPAVCVIAVMLLVFAISALVNKPFNTISHDVKNASKVLEWKIHYIGSSKYVTNIMEEMRTTLGNYAAKKKDRQITLHGHKDEGSLHKAIESNECIFALIFENGNKLKSSTKNLKVTVRSCLRFSVQSELYAVPIDDNLYLKNQEGFLDVQFALIDAILKVEKNETPEYEIKFQHFPIRKLEVGFLQVFGEDFITVLVMLSFSFHCYIITATVGNEKENELKESMKGFGISVGIQWFSWFIAFFVSLFVVIILLVVTCKLVKPNNPLMPNSDGVILFIFFILAACVITAMCLMFSTFFNRAFFGALLCLFFWLASFFLYLILILMKYSSLGTPLKLLSCIVPYCGIAIGIKLFMDFDKAGFGMQWKYLFRRLDGSDGLTLGLVILILLFDLFLFLLIAFYLDKVRPGKSGMPKKWNYLCQRSYWAPDAELESEVEINEEAPDPENFEDEPEDVPVGINIMHLSKRFGSFMAVRDLNLKVYDGKITVLLGHNGAGKTTTMSMVTGLMKPTSGTVIVGEYDILKNVEQIRLQTGLCPQHNVLFDTLTVEDHLYFYCKIKGLKGERLKSEVKNYLLRLHLEHVKNKKSMLLSGGEQRKLSVGLAFCGGSKFIILDEPTSGMDPRGRRQLWSLLEQEKQGRTILMSTHFMDEADTLGDRIAIMHHGTVECCGSPFFLKKKYGAGYKLTIVKQPDCDTEAVTRALQGHIPSVKLILDRRSEINYLLRNEDSGQFESLLSDLEQRQTALKVESFGLSVTTLEDVFLRVGAPHSSDDEAVKEEEFEMVHIALKKGSVVWLYQIFALFLKRSLYAWRSWVSLIVILVIPSAAFAMMFKEKADIKTNQQSIFSSDAIVLDSNLYNDIKIPIEENSGNAGNDKLSDTYKSITKGFIVKDIEAHLKKVIEYDPVASRANYIYGASFIKSNEVIAWYSLEGVHSVPLSLLMVQNAILKKHVGKTVTLVNHPLPLADKGSHSSAQSITNSDAGQFLELLFVALALYVIFYIRERSLRAKHLQFTSGVSIALYWVFNYTWDMFFYLLTLSPAICVVYFKNEDDPDVQTVAGALMVACVLFGFCVLPLIYLCSFITKCFPGGFCIVFFGNYILGTAYNLFFLYNKLDKPVLHRWGFIFLPMCSMVEYLVTIGVHWTSGSWDTLYSFEKDGVLHRIIFFILEGILFFIVLLFIDYDVFRRLVYGMTHKKNIPIRVVPTDPDVIETAKMVHEKDIKELARHYELVIKDLSKKYEFKKYAVDQINFAVEKGECFGLLGTNGAGKTSTFKMILGDMRIGEGDVYMHGYSVKHVRSQTFNYVGYCPQFEGVLPELTVRETLYMYALIRGIPVKHIKSTIYEMANTMLFTEHLDKKIENLSGGTKRKVSACLAIMANPPLILLDEPTTGIDPDAKRRIWDLISALRESGSCIVLCSHSMDECEALCTRLTIMVRGHLMCIGSIQHLKSTFSKEYSLMIKGKVQSLPSPPQVQPDMPPPPPPDPCQMDLIKKFVFDTFPDSYIMEEHYCFVSFGIKTDLPVSKLFGIMEKARNTLVFEDYLLGQCTLEQVFMKLTKAAEN